jgi:hypothetical protein
MDQTIPALSLRQPWLWAILHAGKRIENRTWATKYRGRIRLHAAKTWDAEGEYWLASHGFTPPSPIEMNNSFQIGAYLGEVTVADCWALDDMNRLCDPDFEDQQEPWIFGPVCWVLKDPIAYREPIPGRGYPGLFYDPPLGGRREPRR